MGRIPLEELARLPTVFMPAVSWQQDRVAFFWDVSGSLELYLLDVATGERRQVTHGGLPKSLHAGFVWSRAGDRIALPRDTNGDEQHNVVLCDLATGELTQLTDDPSCQEYPAGFSPGDAWLLVLANKVGQLNLWRMRPDGSEYTQLTQYPFPIFTATWSPDGTQIAYVTNETPDLQNADIYVMNADGSEPRRVLHVADGSKDVVTDWSPDGRTLAVTSDASGVHRPGLLDLATGEVRWLGDDGVDQSSGEFSHDGGSLLCGRNRDSQTEIVIYDVATGSPREPKLPPGVTGWASWALGDSALVFMESRPTARADLSLYALADDSVRVLLPAEYGSIDRTAFVDCDYVWYESVDGLRIPALLYRPRDAAPSAKLPAIVHVHGGPTWQWERGFDAFAQFLADRGYVVLEPNPRGSTGYGVAFRDAALLDWGGMDLEDIAAGAGYLKTLPEVDPERIAVFGGSYGGFMSFLAPVKKPELFKAAVAWVGISDLRRMYDSSMPHFQYFLRQQMGDPEERAEVWHDRSAVNFMDKLRAKLLILHGVNDPRCPIDQARIVRDRLLALGKREGEDFEYVELADEGHGSTDQEQKVRSFRLLADFLDRAL